MADIPENAKCSASPDHGDILATIQNAADDWQAQGYPSALAEVRDMANVGRALMKAIADNAGSPPLIGWHPADCPSEIVSDLLNMLDDATRAAPPAMDREAVEAGGYVLVPAVATRAMVDAADACTDAYSAYAAMVQTGGKKPIFAADVLTEQWLADVLQDTLEMDWNTTDGARGIVRALKNGLVTFPQSGGQILSTLSADAIRQGEGLSDADLKDAVTELLSHRGESPYRILRGGSALWETWVPSFRAAIRYLPATPASHASDGGKA